MNKFGYKTDKVSLQKQREVFEERGYTAHYEMTSFTQI